MNNQEYEQKLQECWDDYTRKCAHEGKSAYGAFCFAFDRAYALGKQEKDAEGEEMLTVSRNEVRDIYEKIDSVWLREGLERLFGSKCLPDNVDGSESDSLAHLEPKAKSDFTPIPEKTFVSNWDKTEQKPAEPKFKVGDIVRFKYCCTPHQIDGFKILNGVMLYYVGEVWAEESDLEPYTKPDTSHETPVCENHSDNTSQKEVNMNTYRNLSQEAANCDNQFDNMLKGSFRNERRLNIAAMAMRGILSNPQLLKIIIKTYQEEIGSPDIFVAVAKAAKAQADALLAECEN